MRASMTPFWNIPTPDLTSSCSVFVYNKCTRKFIIIFLMIIILSVLGMVFDQCRWLAHQTFQLFNPALRNLRIRGERNLWKWKEFCSWEKTRLESNSLSSSLAGKTFGHTEGWASSMWFLQIRLYWASWARGLLGDWRRELNCERRWREQGESRGLGILQLCCCSLSPDFWAALLHSVVFWGFFLFVNSACRTQILFWCFTPPFPVRKEKFFGCCGWQTALCSSPLSGFAGTYQNWTSLFPRVLAVAWRRGFIQMRAQKRLSFKILWVQNIKCHNNISSNGPIKILLLSPLLSKWSMPELCFRK